MSKTLKQIAPRALAAAIALTALALAGCYSRILPEPPQNRQGVLAVAGAFNTRDLGGLPGYDGRAVRWGLLIRSGELDMLAPRGRDFLFGQGGDRMGVATVVDFRCAVPRLYFADGGDLEIAGASSERTRAPSRMPGDALWPQDTGISGTAVSYGIEEIMWNRDIDFDEIVRRMLQGHRDLVTLHRDRYLAFFDALLAAEGRPVLFHCSNGKDRTGVATALLLMALGVDDKYIENNYMQSLELVHERLFPVVPFVQGQMARDMRDRRPDALILAAGTPEEGTPVLERLQQEARRNVLRGLMQDFFSDIVAKDTGVPLEYAIERTGGEGDRIVEALDGSPSDDQEMQAIRADIEAAFNESRDWMLELGRIPGDEFDGWVEDFVQNAGNNIRPTLSVFRQWIVAAIDEVRSEWGGIEGFLEDVRPGMTGADVVAALRELYLEPALEPTL